MLPYCDWGLLLMLLVLFILFCLVLCHILFQRKELLTSLSCPEHELGFLTAMIYVIKEVMMVASRIV